MPVIWKAVLVMLAVAGAALAAFVVILIASPLASVQPSWASEAFTGFVSAAVWMIAGMLVAPRHVVITATLFLVGMACAWFVSRGVVHSVSPYYGLVSIAAACAGGALAWASVNRTMGRRIPILASALPLGALIAGAGVTLATPAVAVKRPLWNGDRDPTHVHLLVTVRETASALYFWTETSATIDPSESIRVETDPGYGAGEYRLTQVRAAGEIDALCSEFREYTRAMIDSEIARGVIPRFMERIPYNSGRCEQGSMWHAVPAHAG